MGAVQGAVELLDAPGHLLLAVLDLAQLTASLVDLVLRGLQGLNDGLQLDLARAQALLQLALLLLQSA